MVLILISFLFSILPYGLATYSNPSMAKMKSFFTTLKQKHKSKERQPFTFDLIKGDIGKVTKKFQTTPDLTVLRYNNVKYIRDLESQRIFALASHKTHLNGKIGNGANGIVKQAIDIHDPLQPIVVKKPVKGFYLDLEQEAKKLDLLGLLYKDIKTPVTKPGSYKQYMIMKQAGGPDFRKFIVNSKLPPKEIDSAVTNAFSALDKLHGKGYVHGDSHLGNFKIQNKGQAVTLIDAAEVGKPGTGRLLDATTDKLVLSYLLLKELKFIQMRNNALPELRANNKDLKVIENRIQNQYDNLAKGRNKDLDPQLRMRYGDDFVDLLVLNDFPNKIR